MIRKIINGIFTVIGKILVAIAYILAYILLMVALVVLASMISPLCGILTVISFIVFLGNQLCRICP
jgi:hypothetical protein